MYLFKTVTLAISYRLFSGGILSWVPRLIMTWLKLDSQNMFSVEGKTDYTPISCIVCCWLVIYQMIQINQMVWFQLNNLNSLKETSIICTWIARDTLWSLLLSLPVYVLCFLLFPSTCICNQYVNERIHV